MSPELKSLESSLPGYCRISFCIVIGIHFNIPSLTAQPVNDNCAKAAIINISNGGFGLGTFNSTTDDITSATVQNGETFAQTIFQNGLDQNQSGIICIADQTHGKCNTAT